MDNDLLPGERVLWEGRPARRHVIRRADAALIPFSLVWWAFAIFWETSVIADDAPAFAKLWGIPFVLVGIYLVAGRFVLRALAFRHTRYTVTGTRILVHGGWNGKALTTAYLKSLPPPVISEKPDGSGDLAFGGFPGLGDAFTSGRRNSWRMWSAEPQTEPVFWAVPDVRRVRDFVAHAQSQV